MIPWPTLTTPHGPLTHLGQPPMVPSLILNQLIKNDLDLFLLDTVVVVAGVALIYIRIDCAVGLRLLYRRSSDSSSTKIEMQVTIEAIDFHTGTLTGNKQGSEKQKN